MSKQSISIFDLGSLIKEQLPQYSTKLRSSVNVIIATFSVIFAAPVLCFELSWENITKKEFSDNVLDLKQTTEESHSSANLIETVDKMKNTVQLKEETVWLTQDNFLEIMDICLENNVDIEQLIDVDLINQQVYTIFINPMNPIEKFREIVLNDDARKAFILSKELEIETERLEQEQLIFKKRCESIDYKHYTNLIFELVLNQAIIMNKEIDLHNEQVKKKEMTRRENLAKRLLEEEKLLKLNKEKIELQKKTNEKTEK